MNRAEISSRIADLEAERTRRNSQRMELAFQRLWPALDRALFPDSPSQRGNDFARAEKPLIALTGRILAGTETDGDRVVLAALPAEELAVYAGGIDAREFVCSFGKIFSLI